MRVFILIYLLLMLPKVALGDTEQCAGELRPQAEMAMATHHACPPVDCEDSDTCTVCCALTLIPNQLLSIDQLIIQTPVDSYLRFIPESSYSHLYKPPKLV